MPLGPKLVLALLIIGLASVFFLLFVRMSVVLGDMLGITIQIALLVGLYTRQSVAWLTARWFTAIGATIMSILFVWVVMAGATKLWILTIVALDITIAWIFFALLGRADSRTYFNAPRKA
jgi:hypothetical protein